MIGVGQVELFRIEHRSSPCLVKGLCAASYFRCFRGSIVRFCDGVEAELTETKYNDTRYVYERAPIYLLTPPSQMYDAFPRCNSDAVLSMYLPSFVQYIKRFRLL
jgi:hypothetical protein